MANVIDNAVTFFDKFGLMTGDYAELKRAALGAATVGFVLTYLKPDLMFSNGVVRPWSVIETDASKSPTMFTLWHAMILGGFVAGVVI